MPQRLQIVARCLVVLTGNFLNIVANSSFIDRSSNKLDVRQRRATEMPVSWFSLDHEKTLIFSGYCSESQAVSAVVTLRFCPEMA